MPALLPAFFYMPLNGSGGDMPVPSVTSREEPVVGSLYPHILPQNAENHGGKHDIALFSAFSLFDVNLSSLGVDVRDLQASGLAHTEASRVQDKGDGALFRAS
jgi:hypothetical protein